MLVRATALTLAALAAQAAADDSRTYSTVTGLFMQDDSTTDPSTFDPTANNFGLKTLNATTGQNTTTWPSLTAHLAALNAAAPSNTSYKLIYLARHGEGWHNVAQAYYGDVAWFAHWCELSGNGTVTWFDAHLTPNGEAQATNLSKAWQRQLSPDVGTPAPQSYYVSPLDRTCATANLTFGGLTLPEGATPFVPTVKENLRETLGVATEDERSNKTYIAGQFPTYKFEAGFTEDDELWSAWRLELPWEQKDRLKGLLDDVWEHDDNQVISFTSHEESVNALLSVIGHRDYDLPTAGMLPVLIESVVSS